MTLRVLWVHNNASPAAGTFMWDQFAAFREFPDVSIEEFFIPVQPRLGDLPGLMRRLRQNSSGFDLVHCQYGSFVGLCAIACLCPVVISLRGSDIYGLGAMTFRNLIPAAVRILFSFLGAAWSSQIIVMSEAMRRKAQQTEQRDAHSLSVGHSAGS